MRRPFHALTGIFTAVHQLLELGFGTGVIGQSRSGLVPAIAASTLLDGSWVALADRERSDPVLAFLAGVGLGVPAIHFVLWPWRLRRVPLLTEAEGLPKKVMPIYNAVLYGWAVSAALALAIETPKRDRLFAVPGAASVFLARKSIEKHFRWMAEEANRNRRWWNRAWVEPVR